MTAAVRTALTLSVLALVLVIGAAWGWNSATEPFPGKVEAPTCVDVAFDAGDRVFPGDVTVSVLNASNRDGLARRTRRLFEEAGFAQGDLANAPVTIDVTNVQIWTTDPTNPAVRLVKSHLRKAKVVENTAAGAGVVVIVGDQFKKVKKKGRRSVRAKEATTVCGPPVA